MNRGTAVADRSALPDAVRVCLLSVALTGLWFWLQGNLLLNLADEGFLWYGAWRTALGDVPLRDFQSYDPGRYYWIAAWSRLFGDGILGVRAAVSLFQLVGLTLGLLTLRRVIRSWWGLALAGSLLLIWMYPRQKVFDHSIALAAVYFAVLVLEKPSAARHFVAGLFVGVAAFFGRNFGLYCLVSFLALILLIRLKQDGRDLDKRLLTWGAGIAVGYSPMLVMLALVPGLGQAVMESIAFLFRIKGTNLALKVPWPWTIDLSWPVGFETLRSLATGILFALLPLFYVVAGLFLLMSRQAWTGPKTVLAASVLVGVSFLHHAFSRADLGHLAQAIHPFLLGIIVLPWLVKGRYPRTLAAALLATVVVLSMATALTVTPYYQKLSAPEGAFTDIDVRGSHLQVYASTANLIHSVERIERRAGDGEQLLIAPHWPGFYPLLKRKSPLWEIYFLFPETDARQREMIRDLEAQNVSWIILGDVPLDGRDELRFRHTHPLLWQYFQAHYLPVQAEGLPENYHVLRRGKTLAR
jgi:hypothetical protein